MKKMFIAIALLFSLILTSANAVDVTQEAKITGLYVGYFNRASDQEGLKYWTAKSDEVAQAGGDTSLVFKKLSAGFATHPTFKSTYDDLNNKEFVSLIYRNALGRDGDAEGIAYWTKKLDNEGMIRSDMVSDFVELSLVTDLTPENYPNLTEEERAAAQLRQDLITNKVTAALAFTHQLGDKSNVLDSQEPEDDPAYKASIKIISEVTEDEQTVSIIIAFLGSIRGYDDPLAMIDSYRGTEEDACISDLTYQNGTIYTFCYIGVPAEVCREIQGNDEEKEWHSFTAEGQCIGLGYLQNSKTQTYGSYTRYHASGLFEKLIDVSESSIGTLDLSYDYVTFWKQVASEVEADTYDDAQYLYSVVPDTDQCDMGALSEEAKQRASLVLNHTRELHGLSSLAYNYAFDDEVQASALIMKANNTMTHQPSSDSLCYTQEGYTGSSTSNIFFGHSVIDPAKHIIDWMNDANNVSLVAAVGHRRWMQNPFEKYLAYGQNEGFSALKTFDFDQTFNTNINVDYVAFPYKRYPYVFISNNPEKPTPWSFSIVEKKDNYTNNSFNYFELSSVEVREKMSGALLDIIMLPFS